MTETREDFRDRIRSIMISAALASDFPDNTGGQLADAAEAAYAQALRDARDRMRSIERDMGSKAWAAGWAADEIEDLAQEIGIDL